MLVGPRFVIPAELGGRRLAWMSSRRCPQQGEDDMGGEAQRRSGSEGLSQRQLAQRQACAAALSPATRRALRCT